MSFDVRAYHKSLMKFTYVKAIGPDSQNLIRLYTVLINALPNSETCFLPLSHTTNGQIFPRELFKGTFLLFMSVIACWHA